MLEITDESKLPAILSISDQCGQNDMGNMSGVQVHEFEYYQENNLSYSTAETISIYDDEADYGLLGVFSSGTESSLNRTTMQGSSIGGSISIGPGSNITSKTYTVGGNYTYSDSKSESNVMIIDIDGDGLNDRVYKKDENYYYRKCIYNGDIIAYSSNERVLTGLPSIGKSFSYSHTWGAEIDLQPVRGDYNKRTTMSHNISYFSDVNADGYIDFIDEGSVYFNMPIEGIPKFGKNNNDTVYNPGSSCNYIVRSERIDSSIYIDNSEVDFCRDAVRMWVAPFAGDIEVLAPIQLIEDTSVIRDKSPSADGLIYSIQLSNSILIWDTIYEDEYNVQNLTPLQIYVDKGQHLYFRINSIKHRSFDIVKWSPRIRYYNRDTVITDANNLKINVFDVADDIIVGQNQIFIAPFQGTVRLKGVLNSTAQSDNIVFEIKKNMTVESSKSFSNATPISYSIDTTMVLNEGDSIALNIKTNTNIRLNDIGHTLKLEYLASDSITIDTNDQFGRLELRPELVFNYHQNTINTSSKVSISSGLHTFMPVIGFSPTSLANGVMTFALKQNQHLLAKKTFTVSGGVIPSSAEISYSFTNATNIYCELYTEDVNLSNTISIGTISIDNGNSYCSTGIHAALADSLIKFGNLYRGWGQFGYKDDNCSGNTPINEKLLYIHKDTVMFDLDTTVITTYDQLKDSLDKYDVGDGKNMNFVPLFPLNDSTLWVDYTGMISVSGGSLSNRQSLAGSSLSSENGSIDNSSNVINPNIKNWTVRKTSKQITKTFSIGASIKSFQVGLSWGNGDNTALVDYRDMNGDRYPDVVSQKIQYTNPLGGYMPTAVNPTLYNNQINYSSNSSYGPSIGLSSKETKGDGTDNTEGQSRVLEGNLSLSYGNSSNNTEYSLFDINGDGLADKINSNGAVQLNMGYKFEDIVSDNTIIPYSNGVSNDYGLSGGFGTPSASTSSMSWSLGVALTYALNRSDAQYLDVNGDGLIDLLYYDNHNIYVKLNNGSSYNSAVLLKSDEKIHRSTAYNGSANASLALGFSVSLFKVVAGLKGSVSQSNQLDKQSLIDMNNDGYVDIVTISGSNEIKVQFSNLGKINMLKKVTTPTNASFSMDYELTQSSTDMPSRKWVMNTVKTYDGYSGDGFDSLINVYEYANPYYDRFERTFYGFNKVKTKQLSSIIATYDYRTTTEEFINDDFYYKGKMISQALTDSLGDTLTKTVYTYTARDCSGPLSYDFPALLAVDNYFYEGNATAQMHTKQEFGYDSLANIISVDDKRNTAITTDDVQSYITYSIDTTINLLSLPDTIEVKQGTTLLRKRTAVYNMTLGELSSMTVHNGSQSSIYSFNYDSYGNMSRFTLPENYNSQSMYYEYYYDGVIHSLPTYISDAFGYSSETTYDYRIQAPLSTKDMTGNDMEYTYYSDGALETVTGPNELANPQATYSIKFEYYNQNAPVSNQPWAKTTYFDPLNTGNEFFNTMFSDGVGRIIQTKTKAVIFNQSTGLDDEVLTVSGKNIIDTYGRVIYSYYPDVDNNVGNTTSLYTNGYQTINTKITYDAMDRKTNIRMPDNTNNSISYGFGNDAFGVKQFMQKTEDAIYTTFYSYTNAMGKQTTLRAPLSTITKFVYNPLGELTQSADPQSNNTNYVYDDIGQLLSRTHPDAGVTSYTYDDAGNLRTVQTANLAAQSQTINYYYDFNRLTKVEYPNSLGNDVFYEYGGLDPQTHLPTNQTGRLVKMQDASGVQEFAYGNMGELTENIHTFVVPGGDPYTFKMKWAYDSWNRIDSIYYPDGEEVNYEYNNAGQLISLDGTKGQHPTKSYVDSIRYDKFGSRVRIRYGNETATKYTYDAQSRRLTNLKTWDAQSNVMQDINYNYIANGNINGAINSAGSINTMGGNATYYHAYDSLSRLIWSYGSFTDANNDNYNYTLTMQYSASGNITQKSLTGSTLLEGAISNVSYTNDYTYNSAQPHTVQSINDNQNYTHFMTWDANGNMTNLNNTATGINRNMCWDEENRLAVVRDPQQLSHYIYNAGGERVWKLTGAIEQMSVNGDDFINQTILEKTLYTSPYMILTDREYTKHYYIESQRVTTKLGCGMANNLVNPISGTLDAIEGDVNLIAEDLRNNLVAYSCAEEVEIEIEPIFPNMDELMQQDDEEGELYFYHGDHLGSSSWITDGSGNVNQYLAYLPFGEDFIRQRSDREIRFKFTGKERDSETGFDYFGARYYESDLSVWLSVDPLSDMYPSTSPFTYVENNPIMFVDPNGMYKDPANVQKAQKLATEKHGANRVGEVFNKGTESKPNHTFNIYKEGQDKKTHVQSDGSFMGYKPDINISNDLSNNLYGTIVCNTPDNTATFKQTNVTAIDNWSNNSNFFAQLSYGIVDDFTVYGTALVLGPEKMRHINGEGANKNELRSAGINTLTNFVPISKIGSTLKIGKKVLNAAQFSNVFTNTGAVKGVSAAQRGFNNRMLNHTIKQNNAFQKALPVFMWGTAAGSTQGN